MMTPEDVRRMIEAGASLVALNTGIRENGVKLLKHASRALATKDDKVTETNNVAEDNNKTEK